MSSENKQTGETPHYKLENYQINNLEDEMRAGQLCKQLLQEYHQDLLQRLKLDPLDAGVQAAGADYFLIDFMIDNQRANIFQIDQRAIERFAGHWYIVSNLEPNLEELAGMLKGIAGFYAFLAKKQLIDFGTSHLVSDCCGQLDLFQARIDSFHAISGDGFSAWEKACPLK